MAEWLRRHIVALVVVDLVASLGVWVFFGVLSVEQSRLNARSDCWFGVLDRAVAHPAPLTPTQRAALTDRADICAHLLPPLPHRTRG